jgi:GNAT superfamily N-acetyltransferase
MKRVHRLVVLPDYQGIGLGTKFESFIAGLFKGKGFQFFTTTSAKNSIMAKVNSKDWKCTRHNIVSGGSRTATKQ